MKNILVTLLLFMSLGGFSQPNKVDSLERLLKSSSHDTTKLNLYLQFCEVCELKDNFKYGEAGIKMLEKIENKTLPSISKTRLLKAKATFLSCISDYYHGVDQNYARAIETNQERIAIYSILRDTTETENTFSKNLEYIYLAGNASRALDSLFARLKHYESIKNSQWIGFYLYKLGDAYKITESFDKAIEYYTKSLEVFKKLHSQDKIESLIENLAKMYGGKKDFKKALEYSLELKKILGSSGNKRLVCQSNFRVADAYEDLLDTTNAFAFNALALSQALELKDDATVGACLRQKAHIYIWVLSDYKNGLHYSEEALSWIKLSGNVDMLFTCHETIVKTALGDKQISLALKHAIEADSVARKMHNWSYIARINLLLFDIYSDQLNYKKALSHHFTYLHAKDSLSRIRNQTELIQKSIKYEFEKSELNLKAEQDKKNIEAAVEKKNQRLVLLSVSGLLILILVFSAFILRSLNTTRKQKKIIEEQKHLVEEKHKEITDSINYAERIQKSFLATKKHLDENLSDYFILFKPKDVVSGDFYWSSTLNNGSFALATADSTGHGVPGAIMSLLNITSLEKAIETEITPDKILNTTRKIIIERLKKDGSELGGKDGMDCSLCMFDFKNTKLFVANANNPVWIVRNVILSGSEGSQEGDASLSLSMTEREVIEIKGDKMPVGKHDNQDIPFTLKVYELRKGDIIYTLTDGFPDQFGGEKGKKFMSKNLRELLVANSQLPMQDQRSLLEKTFKDWVGDLEQVDDVTVIGIKL